MYKLKNKALKILKIIHLFGASCWFGGAISLLLLNMNNAVATSNNMLYGINMASHVIDMVVVVTFGVYGCILTGIIYGIFTNFGFFKYKWVKIKWLITIICFMSGWLFLGNYEHAMLELSRNANILMHKNMEYLAIRRHHLILSCVQIALLGTIFLVSVFKPGKKKSKI